MEKILNVIRTGPVIESAMKGIEDKASSLGVDVDATGLPPGDDFGVNSDDEDIYQEDNLESESDFCNFVTVDNLPVRAPQCFIRGIHNYPCVIKDDGFWMPVDPDTEMPVGYCVIEYNTHEEARCAKWETCKLLWDLYKASVTRFDDFDRFVKVPDEWALPETEPYTPMENLQYWLTDAEARDQFVIRAGSDTEVLWNDARHLKPDPVYKRTFWTESFVQWSPLGTYLATVHRQGPIVWGGASTFHCLMRYKHPQVKLVDFSPGEKYLVTYSSHEPCNPRDANRVVIKIFNVRTGKVMRNFEGSADDFAIGGTGGVAGVSWPVFRWSGGRDDKYFARMRKNVLSVYDTETFSLIDKKSLKVENVMDFSWSPTDPIISLFVPEMGGGNQPARVSLIQIPSKEELRQKNLFSASDCKMYWQSHGEYLAVKVDRYTKTKKSTYTGFELFRIKERDIPVEVLELENKNDKIIAFAWEPKGHRFVVIHGDNPKPDVSIYSMRTAQNTGRVSKLTTLKGKQANALFWSPAGRFIVLAGLKGFNGQLEFYNVDELQTMATAEHFMATDIEWDPTGRYVATAVTSVHDMENDFNIWSFDGKHVYRILKDNFFQFSWRPRPPSFLSAEKEEEIAKNSKKYIKKYEAEDQEQECEKRRMVKDDWDKYVNELKRYKEGQSFKKEHKLYWQNVWHEDEEYEASDEEEEYEASDEKEEYETSDEEEEYEAKDIEVKNVINVSQEVNVVKMEFFRRHGICR